MERKRIFQYGFLILIVALYIWHANSLSFTQDDSFITYRYAKNFLGGVGLVFNPGEYVEGYTNFFYMILLILVGALGGNFITFSKLLGFGSGVAIIMISFFWLKDIGKNRNPVLAYSAPSLLAVNSAFAYWTVSGLETLFFSALLLCGIYLASKRDILFAPLMALATITRPEGGLVFILILAYFQISHRVEKRELARYAIIYALLILPQIIFRLLYYHDILPNPFYAKTGLSIEYISSGVGYFWLFLKQYGFYGILLIIPIAGFRFLKKEFGMAMFVSLGYLLYIIFIGGDVLHGNRFFVPLMPIFYMLFGIALIEWIEKGFGNKRLAGNLAAVVFLLAAGIVTYIIPHGQMMTFRQAEIGLVRKMKMWTDAVNKTRAGELTVACSTIGAFGYYCDATVIDMLGLTDRTIAKNPQSVPGIESTWKERNYNIQYLMERRPDLILFSTGLKPSAPAEKALFLSSRFRQGYYPLYLGEQDNWVIFKRKSEEAVPDKYFSDISFINDYAAALNYRMSGQFDSAFELAKKSIDSGPDDFYLPQVLMAEVLFGWNRHPEGVSILKRAYKTSEGFSVAAGGILAKYYELIGDSSKAIPYLQRIQLINRIN